MKKGDRVEDQIQTAAVIGEGSGITAASNFLPKADITLLSNSTQISRTRRIVSLRQTASPSPGFTGAQRFFLHAGFVACCLS